MKTQLNSLNLINSLNLDNFILPNNSILVINSILLESLNTHQHKFIPIINSIFISQIAITNINKNNNKPHPSNNKYHSNNTQNNNKHLIITTSMQSINKNMILHQVKPYSLNNPIIYSHTKYSLLTKNNQIINYSNYKHQVHFIISKHNKIKNKSR